jgi:hypothetical protein
LLLRRAQQYGNPKKVTNTMNWIVFGTTVHGKGVGLEGDD